MSLLFFCYRRRSDSLVYYSLLSLFFLIFLLFYTIFTGGKNVTLNSIIHEYKNLFKTDPLLDWSTTHTSFDNNVHDNLTQNEEVIPWHFRYMWSPLKNQYYLGNRISPYLGEGIDIYIIDFGIDVDHPEFSGRAKEIWNPYKAELPCYDHGTAVASVAAGLYSGLAKSAQIYSLVVGLGEKCRNHTVDKEWRYHSAPDSYDILQTINFLSSRLHEEFNKTNNKKKSIVNLSLGSNHSLYHAPEFQTSFDSLLKNDIIVTVAAGNDGKNASNSWPASDPRVFTVGGYNTYGAYWSHSNYGKVVDVYGPAVDMISAEEDAIWGYRSLNGTSFAAPFVCGYMASIWSLYTNFTGDEVMSYTKQVFPSFILPLP